MIWESIASALIAVAPYLGIALAVLASGFFSGNETGAYRLNRVRLHLAEQKGRPEAKLLVRMLSDMRGQICVMLIGTNLSVYVATLLATRLWQSAAALDAGPLYGETMATLTLTPLLFVFAELVPKDIFNTHADRLVYRSARLLWLANVVFRSLALVAVLKGVSSLWTALTRGRRQSDPFPARARLRSILRDSAAEGVVTPYQNELVEKIMNLRSVSVRQAMIPAAKVACLRQGASNAEFRELVGSCPYSRLPVLQTGGHQVTGIVRVNDILQQVAFDEQLDLDRFVRETLEMSPSMTVTQAIFAMQKSRAAMAIVRNPRGQYIGILTLKDLVEEIVGELEAW